MTPQEYNQLKKRAQQVEKQAAQAEGALGQVLVSLKEEFDCDTIDDATRLLESMRTTLVKQENKLARLVEVFEEEYSNALSKTS